jgi:hypothetical protein
MLVCGTCTLEVSGLAHDGAVVGTGYIWVDAGCYKNGNQITTLANSLPVFERFKTINWSLIVSFGYITLS